MRILRLAAGLAFVLAGCAQRYTWYNPSVDPAVAERQQEIDSAECTAIAMQSIPMPVLPAPTPAQNNYPVRGTITLDGENGETYTGQYTANGNAAPPIDLERSFQEGMASAQTVQAYRARDNLAAACMMRRGWVKATAEQQPNPVTASASVIPTPQPTAAQPIQSAAPIATVASPSGAAYQGFDAWQKNHGN
jgi:hypothetical protein